MIFTFTYIFMYTTTDICINDDEYRKQKLVVRDLFLKICKQLCNIYAINFMFRKRVTQKIKDISGPNQWRF